VDESPPQRTNVPFSARRVALAIVAVLTVAGGLAWYFEVLDMSASRPPANAIMVISPYVYQGTWVFDDPRAGLVREPFVAGVPEMIDLLVADIPDAKQGFRLTFSAKPFPGYQKKLTWVRGEMGGNYYRLDNPPMEGWLCPALLKYYAAAPPELYVKAEPAGPRP
jgi:hypothetical protein